MSSRQVLARQHQPKGRKSRHLNDSEFDSDDLADETPRNVPVTEPRRLIGNAPKVWSPEYITTARSAEVTGSTKEALPRDTRSRGAIDALSTSLKDHPKSFETEQRRKPVPTDKASSRESRRIAIASTLDRSEALFSVRQKLRSPSHAHRTASSTSLECVSCQSNGLKCVWLQGQESCFGCELAGVVCKPAMPPFESANLNAAIEILDQLPVSTEFKRYFNLVYHVSSTADKKPADWIQYKRFVLKDENCRISLANVVRHQIQALSSELEKEAEAQRSPEENSDPQRRGSGFQISDSYSELPQKPPRTNSDRIYRSSQIITSAAKKSTALSFDPDAVTLSKTGSSVRNAAEIETSGSMYSGTDSTTDSDIDLDLQDLQAIKLYGVILLCLALSRLKKVSLLDLTSGEYKATRRRPAQEPQTTKSSPKHLSGKRKHESRNPNTRASQDTNSDDCEDGDGFSRRPGNKKTRVADEIPDKCSFACPFYKYDPFTYSEQRHDSHPYRNCGSCYLRTIVEVKKHLKERHTYPDVFCPTCFMIFDKRKAPERDAHVRARGCVDAPCPFEEKMDLGKAAAIKSRLRGDDPVEKWYYIFKTLFPGAPRPASPFQEGRMGEMLRYTVTMFRSLLPVASHLYEIMAARSTTQLLPHEAFIVQRAHTYVVNETIPLLQSGSSMSVSLDTLVETSLSDYASRASSQRAQKSALEEQPGDEMAYPADNTACEQDDLKLTPLPNDFDHLFRSAVRELAKTPSSTLEGLGESLFDVADVDFGFSSFD